MKELMERTVSSPDELLRAFGEPDTLDNIKPLYRADDLTVMDFPLLSSMRFCMFRMNVSSSML